MIHVMEKANTHVAFAMAIILATHVLIAKEPPRFPVVNVLAVDTFPVTNAKELGSNTSGIEIYPPLFGEGFTISSLRPQQI